MTYDALLKEVTRKAIKFDKETEAIKLLLLELSGLAPHEFYLSLKETVDEAFIKTFREKADLYILNHIPVQHILGFSYFYGQKFKVSDAVLIPRVETEQLVEHILYYYDKYFTNQQLNVLDLGTGSGCIGLSLAVEEPNLKVTVSDISAEALVITKENGKSLGVDVNYIQSDWFEQINGQFDMIISNPPYIPDSEDVEDIVKREPNVALYGGDSGTMFYKHILENIKPFLKERCLIGFEHGYQQKAEIYAFAKTHLPDAKVIQLTDLQGRDRFTFLGIGGVLDDE